MITRETSSKANDTDEPENVEMSVNEFVCVGKPLKSLELYL